MLPVIEPAGCVQSTSCVRIQQLGCTLKYWLANPAAPLPWLFLAGSACCHCCSAQSCPQPVHHPLGLQLQTPQNQRPHSLAQLLLMVQLQHHSNMHKLIHIITSSTSIRVHCRPWQQGGRRGAWIRVVWSGG